MPTVPPIPIRPYGRARVYGPTGREAAGFDRWAIEEVSVPQPTLMENAGRSAAQILQCLFPDGPVVGLVGSGNNGGDALVLLRTLSAWGREVSAIFVADRGDDALGHGWELPGRSDAQLDGEDGLAVHLRGAGVVVDGVLGTGISGEPRKRQAAAIRALSRAGPPVLSLDIPSGVDAATGATPGDAVRADVTVAFGWPKLGSLLPPGRERSGRLVAVEIGFPPPSGDAPGFGCRVLTPGWVDLHRPTRDPRSHKYSVGSLLVLAGRKGMAGAAVLAAGAAIRSGVGLLRVASPAENREILQERVPEAIFVDARDSDALAEAVEDSAALAAGPGMGTDPEAERALGALLDARDDRPLVLDADALTLLGADGLRGEGSPGRAGPTLLTPHPGEMARISDHGKERIRERPVEVARETAGAAGCSVLLKGLPSVVAEPAGRVLVDVVGTSDLATAGMGDVLTGLCGSFAAQGAGAAVAGGLALWHGGRGARLADRGAGLSPLDVIEAVPRVLGESGPGATELDLPFVLFDRDPPR